MKKIKCFIKTQQIMSFQDGAVGSQESVIVTFPSRIHL